MAAPQLVVAGAPYTVWPGGIIVLRAADWLGASGATTESDARSIEGTVVRETQLTASNIRTAEPTAFFNADDTLTIDLTGIPFETMDYRVFMSVLIEGDWDAASVDGESARESTPVSFSYTARMGLWGDAYFTSIGTASFELPNKLRHYPRNAPGYRMIEFVDPASFVGDTGTLHVIALGGPGSTIEWLIDQIVIIPAFGAGVDADIARVPAKWAEDTTNAIVDGADGGDANGKFTWWPKGTIDEDHASESGLNPILPLNSWEHDGGGDYQDEDSEYFIRIVPDDGWFIEGAGGSGVSGAHAYSLLGAYHRPAEVWDVDTFTRTTIADSLGRTPNGYIWDTLQEQNCNITANGTRGELHFGGTFPRDDGFTWSYLGSGIGEFDVGAVVRAENFYYTGKFQFDNAGSPVPWDGSTDYLRVGVIVDSSADPNPFQRIRGIELDPIGAQWRYVDVSDTPSSWIDISSWFASGVEMGFRIRVDRYRIRARLWEWSAGEPSTWDFDFFRETVEGAVITAYPYSDNPEQAIKTRVNLYPGVSAKSEGYISQWFVYFDDLEWGYAPDVDNAASVFAAMEAPEGTEIGRIEVPADAWHLVYWGFDSWVAADGGGNPNLRFSSKVWNDAGAADLQRAEQPFWWFRAIAPTLVPMNWRSADRSPSRKRVHVGTSPSS